MLETISKPLEDVVEQISLDIEPVQNIIAQQAAQGTLTLEALQVGKMLSHTGTVNVFRTLHENNIDQLDLAKHDPSNPLERIEASLKGATAALLENELDVPESTYQPEMDNTGISNEIYELIQEQDTPVEQQQFLQDSIIAQAEVNEAVVNDTEESQVDALARQIGEEIKEKPDWDEREYGALIYKTADGEIKSSPLSRGQTVEEARAAGQDSPETRLSLPSDMKGGVALGIVHNHPDKGYDNEGDRNNRNPSEGDWNVPKVLEEAGYGESEDITLYIMDKAGHIREYHEHDERRHDGDNSPSNPNETHEIDYDHGL